eukprot:SAG31_NODE_59_length_29571_cov_20.443506_16_plen_45_part_00
MYELVLNLVLMAEVIRRYFGFVCVFRSFCPKLEYFFKITLPGNP